MARKTVVYRLTLSYDGAGFAGWQRQANARSVQQTVEMALTELLDQPIGVVGSSRTDAGVHARGQVCHFHLDREFPLRGLVFGGNHRLPPDVRLLAAHRLPAGFHSQRSAFGKEYSYRYLLSKVDLPLEQQQAARLEFPLELGAVRAALRFLPGRHDFTAFALVGGSHDDPRRRIFAAQVDPTPSGVRFRFWGEGFLRGMVRSLVGTLVEVGCGRRSPASFAELLRPGRHRGEAGPTAEACGLCLEKVFYPPRWQPLAGYEASGRGDHGPLW